MDSDPWPRCIKTTHFSRNNASMNLGSSDAERLAYYEQVEGFSVPDLEKEVRNASSCTCAEIVHACLPSWHQPGMCSTRFKLRCGGFRRRRQARATLHPCRNCACLIADLEPCRACAQCVSSCGAAAKAAADKRDLSHICAEIVHACLQSSS